MTFDRATATRNPDAEFLALGHPFVDAMLRQVGDYSFGGHTAVRVIESADLTLGEPRAGYQFNFVVRGRVQREDGDEYLFTFYPVVIRTDGSSDDRIASLAAENYSADGSLSSPADRLFRELEAMEIESAYDLAKAEVERKAQLWDWEEEVDLIGVGKVAILPAG